jgi:NADH:ubiquinone oxidoreductase subunit D
VPLLINLFHDNSNLTEYNFISNKSLNYFNKANSMESLIEHFKYYSEGLVLQSNHAYASVEAPKGEFGVSLVSNSTPKPFRCKIRTPAYHHLQIMSLLNQGHQFADMITILGSQDIVFGEVDR